MLLYFKSLDFTKVINFRGNPNYQINMYDTLAHSLKNNQMLIICFSMLSYQILSLYSPGQANLQLDSKISCEIKFGNF